MEVVLVQGTVPVQVQDQVQGTVPVPVQVQALAAVKAIHHLIPIQLPILRQILLQALPLKNERRFDDLSRFECHRNNK